MNNNLYFDKIYQYIKVNNLYNEVNKLANKTNNIRLAMILIYENANAIITDNKRLKKLANKINKMEVDHNDMVIRQ